MQFKNLDPILSPDPPGVTSREACPVFPGVTPSSEKCPVFPVVSSCFEKCVVNTRRRRCEDKATNMGLPGPLSHRTQGLNTS